MMSFAHHPYTAAPRGETWDKAVENWKQLASDPDAKYDTEVGRCRLNTSG